MLSATVITPADEIANIESVSPPLMANNVGVSPLVVNVMTSVLSAALSAKFAVWPESIDTPASVIVIVIVIVSELVSSSSSATSITVHVLESSPEPHPGDSKSGAVEKVRAPVAALMEKRSLSVEPTPVDIE